MFKIGDIVELYNSEEDKVYTGMISSNIMASSWHDEEEEYYKVVWFDEKSSLTEEHYSNLEKVS
jgi:hypothetical protein